jgi:hypothetical protein
MNIYVNDARFKEKTAISRKKSNSDTAFGLRTTFDQFGANKAA